MLLNTNKNIEQIDPSLYIFLIFIRSTLQFVNLYTGKKRK